VKGTGVRARLLHESRREDVLSRVLLHVVAPPLTVDAAAHAIGFRKALDEVEDPVLRCLDDPYDADAVDRAEVVRLSSRLRVEVRARKDEGATLGGLEALEDVGLELERVGIGEVEPVRGQTVINSCSFFFTISSTFLMWTSVRS
jgi:hypothetical protein